MFLKIKKDSHGNIPDVWISSDTHYNHKNICRGVTNWKFDWYRDILKETRDFNTLEEMNDCIVNNINAVVKEDDIFIHAGDWSFGGFNFIVEFRNRIKCKNVYLVLGNHDHHIKKNKNDVRDLFTGVDNYLFLSLDGHNIIISHFPIQSWEHLSDGSIHLHGHVHLSKKHKFGRGKKMDIGVDGNDMKPYNILKEIIPIMNKRKIKSDLPHDHHLKPSNILNKILKYIKKWIF